MHGAFFKLNNFTGLIYGKTTNEDICNLFYSCKFHFGAFIDGKALSIVNLN